MEMLLSMDKNATENSVNKIVIQRCIMSTERRMAMAVCDAPGEFCLIHNTTYDSTLRNNPFD